MVTDPRLLEKANNHPRPLVFATLSGAHLYGFPSPDSDYDLRGAHVLPVREMAGLDPGLETIEFSNKSTAATRDALNDLLVRVRLKTMA